MLTTKEIVAKMSEEWRKMEEKEREPYEKLAQKEGERYEAQMRAYRAGIVAAEAAKK